MEVYRYIHKEVEAAVMLNEPPEGSDLKIYSDPDRIATAPVIIEVTLLGYAIAANYGMHRRKLSVEEAREYVALNYFPEETCGDITSLTPKELAKKLNITEEFASYTIRLRKLSQDERKF